MELEKRGMKATDGNSGGLILEPDWIREALKAPLPGNAAHMRMSGRTPQTMEIPEGAAEAAVMIAFLDQSLEREHRLKEFHDSQTNTGDRNEAESYMVHSGNPGLFPLILRPGNQGPHSGQISLPGGKREANESLEETALRETEEEIGLNATEIQVLGSLTPLYIPVSGFAVYPYVGWYSRSPEFKRDPLEVDEILFYDMLRLSHPDYRTVYDFSYNGRQFQSPGFRLDNRIIWGATAMILMELTEHLLSRANR
ncbi:MAG: hypothetical protein CMF59_06885 [Leptospiraceae bacterium]|nr:hypothetical protein [Leptospiraceae bacterium]